MSATAPAHERKPDPAEPWRYVCPDCGSHNIKIISARGRAQRVPGEVYQFSGIGQKAASQPSPPFYCQPCRGRKDRLHDKKTGHAVGPEAF